MAENRKAPASQRSGAHGDDPAVSPTRAEAVTQILEQARILRHLANGYDLRMLAYLLDMVALEALEAKARLGDRKIES